MEFDPFEVKLKKQQIEISVDLKEIKYVELVPSVVGEVAHGYTISSIEMTPSFVEISGAKSLLDKGHLVIYQTAFKMFEIIEDYKFNHKVEIEKGVMEKECKAILQQFFRELRIKKKNKK